MNNTKRASDTIEARNERSTIISKFALQMQRRTGISACFFIDTVYATMEKRGFYNKKEVTK